MVSIRDVARLVRRTPLHPQWLLGPRRLPRGIESARGIFVDIGAADRWVASRLPADTQYFALDYPATSERFYGSKPDVFGDASNLPIADNCVDNIVCLQVVEHLRDPSGSLREMRRILKPGGHAWLSIPFVYPIHNEPYDFQRYTEYGLQREAAEAGFEWLGLERSHHALRASAFVLCLSIAGGVEPRRGMARLLLLPFALVAITVINVSAWLGATVWPDWDKMTLDNLLVLRKPDRNPHGEKGR